MGEACWSKGLVLRAREKNKDNCLSSASYSPATDGSVERRLVLVRFSAIPLLTGQHQIPDKLSERGMGVVFKAKEPRLNIKFALMLDNYL